MSKITTRNLIIALIFFPIVVGMVSVTFFNVLRNSQTLEEQIIAVAAQSAQEAALLRLQRTAQNTEEDRAELASYFLLRESDSISFLSEIESIAPSIGLGLETTELLQITQNNSNWIQATFVVIGARPQVQNFVQILENIPYVSHVTEVSLGGESTGDWKGTITIQVQLLQYDQ